MNLLRFVLMDNDSPALIDQLSFVGDEIALVGVDGGVSTRKELGETIHRAVTWFKDHLADQHGKILTLLPDHPSTLPFQLAACSSIPTVVLNSASSIPEITQLLRETGATYLVTQSSSDAVEALVEQLGLGHIQLLPKPSTHFADFELKVLRESSKKPDHSDVASLILTTSGSSGKPKVVSINSSALFVSAKNIVQSLELGSDDTNVHMLPMFHIGAILDLFIVPLMSGGRICLAHPIRTENLIEAIRTLRPTWIQAVPTMLKSLIRSCSNDELRDLGSSLRFIRSVSAGLAPGVQKEIESKMDTPVLQMYGMTETTGQICSNGFLDNSRKSGSVGRPMGCEVRILDKNGNVVSLGQDGEVCVAGDAVFSGYTNINRAETFHGRWFRTGDLGYFDDDNFLYLVGRTGDIINRGGEKLSAAEVEQTLLDYPSVMQAAVFSIPHDTLGEDIGAVIALSPDMKRDEATVREYLAQRLSSYKIPRHLLFVDILPLLASGKIDKKRCREQFLTNQPMKQVRKVQSTIGTEIAFVWSTVLNQPKPLDNDDFFDAGGDSLAAHTFVLTLEERLHVKLPANILFESPTFAELESAVTRLMASSPRDHNEDQVFRTIRAVTAAWSGTRANENSLIVGLGDVGEKKPFFFCVNGSQDYLQLAQKMAPERPFYAMRNLNLLPEKSLENSKKLAKAYADEIEGLQPDGSLTLGGHCGGVDVARMIAELLIARGREIGLIVVIDSVLREPCPAPALVIWTQDSDYSHYSGTTQFIDWERGKDHVFPFGAEFRLIAENHAGLMEGDAVPDLAARIEGVLSRDYEPQNEVETRLADARRSLEARRSLYKAEISVAGTRFFNPDGHVEMLITLKNISSATWAPTSESGILLMAKWKRPSGKMYFDPAGYVELTEAISPGASGTVRMRVKCRRHRTPLWLVVDLVDDGISWFSWAGNPIAEHWMIPRYF